MSEIERPSANPEAGEVPPPLPAPDQTAFRQAVRDHAALLLGRLDAL